MDRLIALYGSTDIGALENSNPTCANVRDCLAVFEHLQAHSFTAAQSYEPIARLAVCPASLSEPFGIFLQDFDGLRKLRQAKQAEFLSQMNILGPASTTLSGATSATRESPLSSVSLDEALAYSTSDRALSASGKRRSRDNEPIDQRSASRPKIGPSPTDWTFPPTTPLPWDINYIPGFSDSSLFLPSDDAAILQASDSSVRLCD
jgi:hypothetical protein